MPVEASPFISKASYKIVRKAPDLNDKRFCTELISIVSFFLISDLIKKQCIPYRHGFFCNDMQIRYPYLNETISYSQFYSIYVAIPICIIVFNEWYLLIQNLPRIMQSKVTLRSFGKLYFWQLYLSLVPLLYACGIALFVNTVAKHSVGRLRPYFIDRCQPMVDNGDIIYRNSACTNHTEYIHFYICSNKQVYENESQSQTIGKIPIVKDGVEQAIFKHVRLSFYSLHTSMAAVVMLYLATYAEYRVNWKQTLLLKEVFQAALICMTLFTAVDHINRHLNHPTDVVCALAIGSLIGVTSALYVKDEPFTEDECEKQSPESSNKSPTSLSYNAPNFFVIRESSQIQLDNTTQK